MLPTASVGHVFQFHLICSELIKKLDLGACIYRESTPMSSVSKSISIMYVLLMKLMFVSCCHLKMCLWFKMTVMIKQQCFAMYVIVFSIVFKLTVEASHGKGSYQLYLIHSSVLKFCYFRIFQLLKYVGVRLLHQQMFCFASALSTIGGALNL